MDTILCTHSNADVTSQITKVFLEQFEYLNPYESRLLMITLLKEGALAEELGLERVVVCFKLPCGAKAITTFEGYLEDMAYLRNIVELHQMGVDLDRVLESVNGAPVPGNELIEIILNRVIVGN